MNDKPRFIVGEVSKNWLPDGAVAQPDRPTISMLFEEVIQDAVSRGYQLHSWHLSTVEDHSYGMINETIVAVFELQEGKALRQELEVTNQLLADRQRVLDAIPACPAHGSCVPHALAWIAKVKASHTAWDEDGVTGRTEPPA